MKLVFLGTGTSHGIPMIGCDCAVCRSADPRDGRTRPSAAVQYEERTILIDTAPELRLQCVANGIRRVDAVVYTHHHADHIMGLDDLRRFNALQKAVVPCYGMAETLAHLARAFPYAFQDDPEYPSAKPLLEGRLLDGPVDLFGQTMIPLRLYHGKMAVLGVRFGGLAYCTDCSQIPPESLTLLEGLEVLVLDALRKRKHPTHFNLEQAVQMATTIGARRTYFTHIAHELGHAETNTDLPKGMQLAYDGQVVEVG